MNFNNYTTKAQETIQLAQEIAQVFGHNQIENEHIFKALTQVDENVLPFILKKLDINIEVSTMEKSIWTNKASEMQFLCETA